MRCTHLSLVNFRNYVRLEMDLDPEAVLLVGENAQGKSNLLEAIYCLATTKSLRAGADREMINWSATGTEAGFARLSARIERESQPLRLEVVIGETPGAKRESGPGVSKRFRVNGVPRRAFDVVGQVNVVHFSPEDVDLVVGPPSGRRRYLDITISQIDPRYVRALARYGKVLLQRNHLLRRIRDHQARADQLSFWDAELVNTGTYVLQRRFETIERLARLGHDAHRRLAGGRELVEIGYRATVSDPAASGDLDEKLGALAAAFRGEMAAAREREIQAGASLVGPHRDDLTFLVDGREVAAYGSRGQQRTVALALKLAETGVMQHETGEWPILLLDDVMSELDAVRRAQVLDAIAPGQQVIMTTTDLSVVDPAFASRASVLRVAQGVIRGEFRALDGVARATA